MYWKFPIHIYDKIYSKLEQKTHTKYDESFRYSSYEPVGNLAEVSRDFCDITS